MRLLVATVFVACLLTTPLLAQDEQQSTVPITADQQQSLYKTLSSKHVKSTNRVAPRVGARVPRIVRLYRMPARAVPASVRHYRYTVADNRFVLVDPKSRKVTMILLGVGF